MLRLRLFVPFCLVISKSSCAFVPAVKGANALNPVDDLQRVTQLIFRPNEAVDELTRTRGLNPQLAGYVNEQPGLYDLMAERGAFLSNTLLRDAKEKNAPIVFESVRHYGLERHAREVDPQVLANRLNTFQHSFYSRLKDIQKAYPEQFNGRVREAAGQLSRLLYGFLETAQTMWVKPIGKPEEIQNWVQRIQRTTQGVQHSPHLLPPKPAKVSLEPVKYLESEQVQENLMRNKLHLIPSNNNQHVAQEATSQKPTPGEKQLPPFGSSQRLTGSQQPYTTSNQQASRPVAVAA